MTMTMLTSNNTFIFNSFIVFYVLCTIFHCTLFFASRVDAFHIQGVHSMFTISLKVIPTLVLAHFGPYHTHFGPKIWVRSGHGPKWVGTEVGIERVTLLCILFCMCPLLVFCRLLTFHLIFSRHLLNPKQSRCRQTTC